MERLKQLENDLAALAYYENTQMYRDLLDDYLRELKRQGMDTVYDVLFSSQEELDKIEKQLPNVTDDTFNRYVLLFDIVEVCNVIIDYS